MIPAAESRHVYSCSALLTQLFTTSPRALVLSPVINDAHCWDKKCRVSFVLYVWLICGNNKE